MIKSPKGKKRRRLNLVGPTMHRGWRGAAHFGLRPSRGRAWQAGSAALGQEARRARRALDLGSGRGPAGSTRRGVNAGRGFVILLSNGGSAATGSWTWQRGAPSSKGNDSMVVGLHVPGRPWRHGTSRGRGGLGASAGGT